MLRRTAGEALGCCVISARFLAGLFDGEGPSLIGSAVIRRGELTQRALLNAMPWFRASLADASRSDAIHKDAARPPEPWISRIAFSEKSNGSGGRAVTSPRFGVRVRALLHEP